MGDWREWVRRHSKLVMAGSIVVGVAGVAIFNAGVEAGALLFLVGIIGVVVAARAARKPKAKEVTGMENHQAGIRLRLAAHAYRVAPDLDKQINESFHLIDNTVNPKTFFGRYEDLIAMLKRRIENENHRGIDSGETTRFLESLDSPQARESRIDAFIRRSYGNMLKEAAKLKTEKGRLGRIEKYFEEMDAYAQSMFSPNLTMLEDLKQMVVAPE